MPVRLSDALASMPPAAFERLLARRGVTIDPRKKITPVEQASRALAMLPAKRVAALPTSAHEVIRALAPRPGRAARAALGGGVLPLIELGLAFPVARDEGADDEIAMPTAYRLQVAAPAGEDPRAARALLGALDAETFRAIALHHLGRPPVAPRPLVVGDLLSVLESSSEIERRVSMLPRPQQRLLAAIEARGGEVTAEELLDLSREPARWGPPSALPKTGQAQALVSAALLLPHGVGCYALPAEVAAIVGRERRALALRIRGDAARTIEREGDEPARARLAEDPGPRAVALLAELAARGELPDGGHAVKRSVSRAAARAVGVDPIEADVLIAIARAARLATTPLADVRAKLLATWRASGAWDEARLEPDRLRATEIASAQPTPTSGVREALLELLASIPDGRFAPIDAVLRAARADLRCDAAATLLERAARRAPGALVADVGVIFDAMLDVSLPALGALDRAPGEVAQVRLAPLARTALRGTVARSRPDAAQGARWESGGRLRVGGAVEVGRILVAARAARAIAQPDHLVLALDRARIEGLAIEGELATVRAALDALAPLHEDAARALAVEARPKIACDLVLASAFLAIPDDALCDAVCADESVAPFVARRPLGGILLREGAPLPRITRAVERLGGSIAKSGAPARPGTKPRNAT
jgi:hypothetical protein